MQLNIICGKPVQDPEAIKKGEVEELPCPSTSCIDNGAVCPYLKAEKA